MFAASPLQIEFHRFCCNQRAGMHEFEAQGADEEMGLRPKDESAIPARCKTHKCVNLKSVDRDAMKINESNYLFQDVDACSPQMTGHPLHSPVLAPNAWLFGCVFRMVALRNGGFVDFFLRKKS